MDKTIKFNIGDRIRRFDRVGMIVDLFEGTEKENFWVRVLYDRTYYDQRDWISTELITSIELLPKEKVINITI